MNRIKVLLNPLIWLQNYRLDLEFDKFLNQSMDDAHPIEVLNGYEFKFNGKTIWMGNYPYACFTISVPTLRVKGQVVKTNTVRPKRTTIIRMIDYIKLVDETLYKYILRND